MKVVNLKESWWLLIGDIIILVVSLWLTLVIRYWEIPRKEVFLDHLLPFTILFIIWCLVFFIAGLYEKHTTLFKSYLPKRLLNAEVFNGFLAVVFFYFVPYFGITPKIILFIYLIIALSLIFVWRVYNQKVFSLKAKVPAMILGRGTEMGALVQEINNNSRYGLNFVSLFDLDKMEDTDYTKIIVEKVKQLKVAVLVVDLQNEKLKKNLSHFYNLLFLQVNFIDINSLYEDVFDRIPLSFVGYDWFLENISLSSRPVYDTLRRIFDFFLAVLFLPILGLVFIFVFLIKKLEDFRPVLIFQDRIGCNGKIIKIIKFRTWLYDDAGDEEAKKNNKITKIGNFLRKVRLDELPQVWNVLKGDLSFIGPRPELPVLVKVYEQEIPYYGVRHLIKPGLSGWAQLLQDNPPKHDTNYDDTKVKLSYDLYYIKNRSLLLDLKIALKTIRALLSRSGR